MIPRRVWINMAVFGALFALLTNWAVRNVITLDLIERPYRITAAFESSPGLRPNVEVTYLGVRVGTIDSLSLTNGDVVVGMDIDRGVDLPVGITAAVRRKSAVGEPYVALEMPEDYAGSGPYIDHDDSYAIPASATSVPLSYGELFVSLDALVTNVPPDDLATVVHEVSAALDGRGQSIRRLIESTGDLTGTLAERSELFDALATDLTVLTHTLSANRGAIGSSFDNLAALTETLAGSRAEIERLLDEAPQLGERVAALLDASVSNLGCLFADTGALFEVVGQPEHVRDLIRVLQTAGPARDALNSALVETGDGGADGPYLGGSFAPTFLDPPPPAYDEQLTFPEPPPLPVCDDTRDPAGGAGAGSGVADDAAAAGTVGPDGGVDVSARPVTPEPAAPASSPRDVGGSGFPLTLVMALVGAGVFGLLLVAMRPWRWVRR